MQLIVVLAAAFGLLLVVSDSATAHPAAQEVGVSGDSELDDEMARKIIGSSVVTSVSVILNGQEPAHFSDAAGKHVPRPMVPPQVGSPINLLNPDRYEFYTFNDNGDLIKRLMTVKEIQSIVAGGAGEGTMFPHHASQLESQKIEDNVEDIVSNVQRVLNNEVDASAKRNESDYTHKLDTPDVSETWSQILPAIFGNTGEVIGPQPRPPQNIAMTTDAVLMLNSPTRKTPSSQSNRIPVDDRHKKKPIEVSTPRSTFDKTADNVLPSGGYRQKTTESPVSSKIPATSRAPTRAPTKARPPTTQTPVPTNPIKLSTIEWESTTQHQLSSDKAPLNTIMDPEKFVTSFSVDTTTSFTPITTDTSAYWAGIPVTTDTIRRSTNPTTTPKQSSLGSSTSRPSTTVFPSISIQNNKQSGATITPLQTTTNNPLSFTKIDSTSSRIPLNFTTTRVPSTTTIVTSATNADSSTSIIVTSTTTVAPARTNSPHIITTVESGPLLNATTPATPTNSTITTTKPVTKTPTKPKTTTTRTTTTMPTTTPQPTSTTTVKPTTTTTVRPTTTTTVRPTITTTERTTTTTTVKTPPTTITTPSTTTTNPTSSALPKTPAVTTESSTKINLNIASAQSTPDNPNGSDLAIIKNVAHVSMQSTLRPKPSMVPSDIIQHSEIQHMEPMNDAIKKLSASLLAQSFDSTTYATEETTTGAAEFGVNTGNDFTATTSLSKDQSETDSLDEKTESLFNSDSSFNQIMESLKHSTDQVGLLLANDENVEHFIAATSTEAIGPATTETVEDVTEYQTTNTDRTSSDRPDTNQLFVEESDPEVFNIPTTTEDAITQSPTTETDTFIDPANSKEDPTSPDLQESYIHPIVQEISEFIDENKLHKIADSLAVESISNNVHVQVLPESALTMSEYVEQAATVASVMSRPSFPADKATRTSETVSGLDDNVSYETSVVKETSSVSMSAHKAPSVEPTLETDLLKESDSSTEISVQSDVHEEVHMVHQHLNKTSPAEEPNIIAEILNPIGAYDEEVIRHRFNEMGEEIEHRDESSTESGSTEESSLSGTESKTESEEDVKSTTTSSDEESSEVNAGSSESHGSTTESSEESSSEHEDDNNEDTDSSVSDLDQAAIEQILKDITREVTTEDLPIETTTEIEYPDSRTVWPSTLNTYDKTTLDSVVSADTNLHNQPLFERIKHKTSTQLVQQSSTEVIQEDVTEADASNESSIATESFEWDTTAAAQNKFSKPDLYVTESSEQFSDTTESTESDNSDGNVSTSSSSSETSEHESDGESSSMPSDEQSTEFIKISSSQEAALMSSESRLGDEANEHLLVDEAMFKVDPIESNDLTDDEITSNQPGSSVTASAEENDESTTLTSNSNIVTTESNLYQNDDPADSSFTTVSFIEPKDEQVFINLGETTTIFSVFSDGTTILPEIQSDTEATSQFSQNTQSNTTINDLVNRNSSVENNFKKEDAPVADGPTVPQTVIAPKDEQVFINLGETTTTATIETTTKTPPRKTLPETQHIIHIKKQALKVDDRSTRPTVAAKIEASKKPVQYARPQPGGDKIKTSTKPAYIKMPPSFSSFKIKGTQASRKPALSVKLDPAPQQALGLEESTTNVSEDIIEFARLCNELAFTFWKSATSEGISSARSLVISPFALTSMLAMVFLGARGSTSGEMNELLRLDDMVTFNPHLIFRNITDSVENPKEANLANAAFVRALFSDRNRGKILPFFKEKSQQYYSGHVEEVNFNLINDIVRRRTNLLVKRHTFGKIGEYLRTNNVWLNAPLAGLTANIFQTDCSKAFVNERDGEMFFQVLPAIRQRRLIPIPAVVWKSGFTAGYDPELDATAVAFGSASNVVSTIFVMPGQQGHAAAGDNLERLEAAMMEDAIPKNVWRRLLTTLMERPGLEVQIPRFSHRSFVNATQGLQKMGLQKLFDIENADLRGLTGSKSNDLYISDMVQVNTFSTCGEEKISDQHHIEMYPAPAIQHRNINSYEADDDEADNEAQETARTQSDESEYDELRLMDDEEDRSLDYTLFDEEYLGLPLPLRPRQARIPESPRLRFDKPFLFFVRHNPTGMILYMGRFNPRLLP